MKTLKYMATFAMLYLYLMLFFVFFDVFQSAQSINGIDPVGPKPRELFVPGLKRVKVDDPPGHTIPSNSVAEEYYQQVFYTGMEWPFKLYWPLCRIWEYLSGN